MTPYEWFGLVATVCLACSGAVFLIVWGTRCLHAWELVDKTEFPPTLDDYVKGGGSRLHYGYLSGGAIERMSRRTVVLALRCSKCGAAKIFKETST